MSEHDDGSHYVKNVRYRTAEPFLDNAWLEISDLSLVDAWRGPGISADGALNAARHSPSVLGTARLQKTSLAVIGADDKPISEFRVSIEPYDDENPERDDLRV